MVPHRAMWSTMHSSAHLLTLAEVVAETVGETLKR